MAIILTKLIIKGIKKANNKHEESKMQANGGQQINDGYYNQPTGATQYTNGPKYPASSNGQYNQQAPAYDAQGYNGAPPPGPPPAHRAKNQKKADKHARKAAKYGI